MDKNNLNVLVVDDDVSIRDSVVLLLDSKGYTNINQAESGSEALTYFEDTEESPDVVFMDTDMGENEVGYVTCKKIRENWW